jgi:WD40 repeat protein
VFRAVVSPDGQLFTSSGAGDRDIRVWSADTRRRPALLQAHTGDVLGLAFTLDGGHLLSAGMNGKVRLWELKRHAVARCVLAPNVTALDVSKDCKVITPGFTLTSMRLLQLPCLKELPVGGRPDDTMFYAALSWDGRLAVAGGGWMGCGTYGPANWWLSLGGTS